MEKKGFPGKLRSAGAAALPRRREGRAAAGARADLFASRLRRDAEPVGRGRSARHPDRRRAQRAADRPAAEGRQGDPVRVGLLRLLGLSSTPRRTCCRLVRRPLPDAARAPRSAIRNPISTATRSCPTTRGGRDRDVDLGSASTCVNLHENILPTRQRADLILKKAANHLVRKWRCGGSSLTRRNAGDLRRRSQPAVRRA